MINDNMASIRDEWRELRSRIINLVCAVDGKVESLEALDKKMQEEVKFEIGDEVEYSDHRNGSCNKYIVIKADSDSNVLWLLDLRTFLRIWIYKDDSSLKKTGKHFDTIDIPEGGATI